MHRRRRVILHDLFHRRRSVVRRRGGKPHAVEAGEPENRRAEPPDQIAELLGEDPDKPSKFPAPKKLSLPIAAGSSPRTIVRLGISYPYPFAIRYIRGHVVAYLSGAFSAHPAGRLHSPVSASPSLVARPPAGPEWPRRSGNIRREEGRRRLTGGERRSGRDMLSAQSAGGARAAGLCPWARSGRTPSDCTTPRGTRPNGWRIVGTYRTAARPTTDRPGRAATARFAFSGVGDKAIAVRSFARFRYDEDVRYYANGFRVARDLD